MADPLQFEEKTGILFNDKRLLRQAFTHRSYINENRRAAFEHNERLEFLGDAVLELVITEFLYRRYPEKPEGELTAYRAALVNSITLARVAVELEINDMLLLSKGERKDTGKARQFILANTVEAIIGAIYLDLGYDKAAEFIHTHISPLIDDVVENKMWIDAKSSFQEQAQEHVGFTPAYKTLKEIGPDHDKFFTVGVFIGGDQVGEGHGNSKQDAEQAAARNALEAKGWL